ncbi:MAG: nitrogen regulation protein NR(I) [Burkholderiaceae bacterium]|jgi:two-component system nitrogen regulation response regulator GlnG|nr:nitrogen regulation protein NR(I) [Burkholderiaceae bacterium]
MKPIWIVDDDPSIRFVLEKALLREALPTRSFTSAREALSALAAIDAAVDAGCGGAGSNLAQQSPQVLISDIRMPGGSGLQLLETIRQTHPALPVIVMTAYSDLDSAVSALQGGAFEYLPKPFDLPRAIELIRRAAGQVEKTTKTEETQGPSPTETPSKSSAKLHPSTAALHTDDAAPAPEMLGQAGAMQDVFRAIGRLAHSKVTVLITGESGTGKELVAHALHRHSPCAQGPFVAINTAAIPKDLLESELFGHERGAFTGAQSLRHGRFEQAESGTLFLDEIGDMPLELQTRLLRVLSDGRFYRVGGHEALKTNVRIIAATHQDLEQRVSEGAFREDLLHRLNVIRLRLPPLRERRADIPALARHFLQRSAQQLGVEPKQISEAALAQLAAFAFPGNVRQLENICHWLTVMAPAQMIEFKDLPPEVMGANADAAPTGSLRLGSLRPETASGVTPETAAGPDGLAHPPAMPQATLDRSGPAAGTLDWESALEREARALLQSGNIPVWDALTRRVESRLIRAALAATGGRRIEAAQKLGIGRNTITRKITALGLDADRGV